MTDALHRSKRSDVTGKHYCIADGEDWPCAGWYMEQQPESMWPEWVREKAASDDGDFGGPHG